MDRADRTLKGLRTSNLSANQSALKEMTALVKYGTRQLEEVYKQTLLSTGASEQIEPLHFIMKDKPFPTIPEQEASQLQTINRYVASSAAQSSQTGECTTAMHYAEIRGNYISRSLTTSSAATLSTARKQNADAIYRRGTCGIGAYATALEGMITAEFENVRSTFSREEWGRVLLSTCRPALGDFGRTLRDLNSHIQANLMTDCFLAYEIIDIVASLALRLDSIGGDIKKTITEVLQPIRDTAKSSVTRMLEDTRGRVQSLISLPAEGSAIPVTMDILTRLQNLAQYLTSVTSLMNSIGDGGWGPSSPTSSLAPSIRSSESGDAPQIFAHYCSDTLETLVSTLDSRARLLLKSQAVQAVFMCNNIAVIEGMIRSSELASLLVSVQPRIDTWRSKHVKLYLNAWTPASSQLLDVQYTNRSSRPTSSGHTDSASVVRGLSTREKDNIKEKFRAFNTAFDDLVAKHRAYRMEKEVRAVLVREVQRIIEPLYGRFWDRYHEVDKGKGKYVRYDKSALSSIFSTLA
jgi:exocyst complex protein 7